MKFKSIYILVIMIMLCGCTERERVTDPGITENQTNTSDNSIQYEIITFACEKNTIGLMYEEKEYGRLSYTTIDLADIWKNDYPSLKQRIDEYNEKQKEKIMESKVENISNHSEFIKEQISDFGSYTYEHICDLIPMRADSEVFSYTVYEQWYDGVGATSQISWWTYNIDPVSGKDIQLSDVVVDRRGIPDIIFQKLIEMKEDLWKQQGDELFHHPNATNTYVLNDTEDFIAHEDFCYISTEDLYYQYIKGCFEGDEKFLIWVLDYDGVWFFFSGTENRAYGIKIRYEDYPDIFAEQFFMENPDGDITTQIIESREAEKQYEELLSN